MDIYNLSSQLITAMVMLITTLFTNKLWRVLVVSYLVYMFTHFPT